jgi:ABC-2 type transport system ATP-binding protein
VILECREVTKSYGRQPVLTDVSFSVSNGECVAILGRNGAGKTTLLHCLLGIEAIESGAITLLGRTHTTRTPLARQSVGHVPESPQFPPGFTATTLFRFLGKVFNGWNSENARSLAVEFAIPMSRPLRQLSKGMRAQISLIVALSHGANLLLLDEPFGDLDPITRGKWLKSVKTYCEASGVACLYSTHTIEDVLACSTRVVILAGSQIRIDLPLSHLATGLYCTSLPDDSAGRANRLNEIGPRAVYLGNELVVHGAKVDHSGRRDGEGLTMDKRVDLLRLFEIVATE